MQVDDRMSTGVPGVYAIGDVTGKLLLAHVAQAQGVLAVETVAGMDSQTLDYRMMPRAVYCQPQVTGFGYSESEATEAGYSVKVGRFPFRANGKSLAAGDSEGMVKVVADGDTGEILGAHMIGAEVTEMLPELAMTNLLEGSGERAGLAGALASHAVGGDQGGSTGRGGGPRSTFDAVAFSRRRAPPRLPTSLPAA